jgi:hypothetical protein
MIKKMVSSRGDTPQKPDHPHTPKQVSRCERQFQRPALPHFVHIEDEMGITLMQLDQRKEWFGV